MSTAQKSTPVVRPKYYDLNLLNLPLAGLVSIFHRITGAVMFLALIPALLYLMQRSLHSEQGYQWVVDLWRQPLVKLVALGFVWSYVHHFFAGIRYLLLDFHIGIAKAASRTSAQIVLIVGLVATALIGYKIW